MTDLPSPRTAGIKGCGDSKLVGFFTSPAGLVLLGFLAIAGVLLFTEHRAHAVGVLLYLPLFICPLMHIVMHGRHGGHGDHGRGGPQGRVS